MKFYFSPLSIFAVFLIAWGIKLGISIMQGSWATYFALILPLLGIALFVLDFFIRKANIATKMKILLQTAITVLLLFVGFLIFKR